MKKSQIFTILLSVAAIAGGLGCVALSEYVTPASIDVRAVEYVDAAGVADANDFAGYGNLFKATKLANAVGKAYQVNQQTLSQLIDKDSLLYSHLAETTQSNQKAAAAREKMLFSEKGLIAMGFSLAGFGTLTGLIGLARKRPKDITPDQLNKAIAGKNAELSDTQKQVAELVKGIQNFIEIPDGSPVTVKTLKDELAKAQSDETKKAVAVLKA